MYKDIVQVKQILKHREKEDSLPQLEVSVYDTMRNDKVKQHRSELVSKRLFYIFIHVE